MLKNKILVGSFLASLFFSSITPVNALELDEDTRTVTLDSKVWSPVINHQDIVPGNLIEKDNRIFFIDWEYSAFGHPDIDLVRLYGLDYESEFTKDLLFLQQGIDKLWGILRG